MMKIIQVEYVSVYVYECIYTSFNKRFGTANYQNILSNAYTVDGDLDIHPFTVS